MDTKSLHDWASDAQLDFKDEDGFHDAKDVWIRNIMGDEECLMDLWLDALAEFHAEDPKGSSYKPLASQKARFATNMGNARVSSVRLESARNTPSTTACEATSFTYRVSQIGEQVFLLIQDYVVKLVEKNADDWWGDVVGYHGDMEQGRYEDHAYQEAKERMGGSD